MQLEELIHQLPWTNHPIVRTFALKFTQEQWQDFTNAGMDKIIANDELDDKHIYELFSDIYEIINNEDFKEALNSKAITLIEAILRNIDFSREHLARKRSEYQLTNIKIISIVNYLLSMGFSKEMLNTIFSYNVEIAIERTGVIAGLVYTEMNLNDKEMALKESWKHSLYPFNLLCKDPEADTSQIYDFIINKLTYEQYVERATRKSSCLFQAKPSYEDFVRLKEETKIHRDFFNYCLDFISRFHATDRPRLGMT